MDDLSLSYQKSIDMQVGGDKDVSTHKMLNEVRGMLNHSSS